VNQQMVSIKYQKIGELFCGPGGIGLGASLAKLEVGNANYKFDTQWATDIDLDSCNTYKQNLISESDSERIICSDIKNIDFNDLDSINGLTFGFPCNDFSMLGQRAGGGGGITGEYGPLYTYGVKALQHFKPDWFMAENVSSLTSSDEGKAFEKILSELNLSGYNLTTHLYRFEKYGIPQKRHRIIIVGIRNDINKSFRVPAPISNVYVSSKEALENPPISINAANNEITQQSKTVVERLKHIKPGENAFTAEIPEKLKLNIKGAKISQIYKRLDPNLPSYTVTGSGGGGSHVYHWEENRSLTNRERARLQSFPDDYVFSGSKESVRKQIGMAVPPMGVKIILESLLKTLHGIQYPYVDSNLPVQYKLI
tara:strand:+ start:2609 stop:3715 length:1107 start_codon:yes stop_codon:yes gene_type:complete